ncbi:MAG TPA: hypothetical protein VE338_15705, partial [Ktedonobacterales bacterium]|nr:hypothetical protein [Ktedonobacterales bacterium]
GGRVDEADARTGFHLRLEVDGPGDQHAGHAFNEARIASQSGELGAQVDLDMLGVEAYERAIAGQMQRPAVARAIQANPVM